MLSYKETSLQEIVDPLLVHAGVRILVKREDLNHSLVSGNKWWKLKYNLEEALKQGHNTILTFGGAYSNHLYAIAAAAHEIGFDSIGLVRGEEILPLNSTLSFAKSHGMKLHYVSREKYRKKHDESFIDDLRNQFGNFYMIPEGGTNSLAVRGVKEFGESLLTVPFDHLCCPVGTGGTLAGFIEAFRGQRQIVGFPVLKDCEFLVEEIQKFLPAILKTKNWKLECGYHCGGYGHVSKALIHFLNEFKNSHDILLDPIYNGKMMAGIFDMIRKHKFPRGSTILAIHTGGIQGWDGINDRNLSL